MPTPVFLPGEFHGQRGLMGPSPWGRKELDTTKQLTHTHTHTQPNQKHVEIETYFWKISHAFGRICPSHDYHLPSLPPTNMKLFSTAKNVDCYVSELYQAGNKEFHVEISVSTSQWEKKLKFWAPGYSTCWLHSSSEKFWKEEGSPASWGGPHSAKLEALWRRVPLMAPLTSWKRWLLFRFINVSWVPLLKSPRSFQKRNLRNVVGGFEMTFDGAKATETNQGWKGR